MPERRSAAFLIFFLKKPHEGKSRESRAAAFSGTFHNRGNFLPFLLCMRGVGSTVRKFSKSFSGRSGFFLIYSPSGEVFFCVFFHLLSFGRGFFLRFFSFTLCTYPTSLFLYMVFKIKLFFKQYHTYLARSWELLP